MSPASARPQSPAVDTFISRDVAALASHMSACQLSRGRFHDPRVALDRLLSRASSRIVTTCSLFGAVALCLLLALT